MKSAVSYLLGPHVAIINLKYCIEPAILSFTFPEGKNQEVRSMYVRNDCSYTFPLSLGKKKKNKAEAKILFVFTSCYHFIQ